MCSDRDIHIKQGIVTTTYTVLCGDSLRGTVGLAGDRLLWVQMHLGSNAPFGGGRIYAQQGSILCFIVLM